MSAQRDFSKIELGVWAVFAWATSSAALSLLPYAVIGLVSFMLLPFIALGWIQTARAAARPGGPGRAPVLLVLALATLVGAAVAFWFVRSALGPPHGA